MAICSSCSARGVRHLDPVLQPAPFLRVLDMHVLGPHGAAVRVAQHAQDVPQLHPRLPAEAAGREVALKVPQGQPVQVDVQVGVLTLGDLEGVGVGHQVTTHPVGVDQLLHPGRDLATLFHAPAGKSLTQRTGSYGMRSAAKISS